jgi:hypothetical protein
MGRRERLRMRRGRHALSLLQSFQPATAAGRFQNRRGSNTSGAERALTEGASKATQPPRHPRSLSLNQIEHREFVRNRTGIIHQGKFSPRAPRRRLPRRCGTAETIVTGES